MAGIQIVGNTNNSTAAEVEVNTKAIRTVVRPNDFGSLGIYSLAGVSGTMAAGLAANSPIYSFRWGNASNLALVRKVLISAGNAGTGFSAGAATFNMFVARSFTASDTGGTSILPTGNSAKLRTSMGTTLLTDVRVSATATLTAGTRTKDTNPAASLLLGFQSTAGLQLIFPTAIFEARVSEYPLVLAQNEGFVIEASVPLTGTWTFAVTTVWEELASY